MRIPTTVATLALLSGLAHAQSHEPRPSTTPQIVVYTMGNGEVLWQKFGHAALCVEYPRERRFDICYNYGTTDFEAPVTLGWTFVRGRSQFWVDIAPRQFMLRVYKAFDRTIYRQTLPLSPDKAQLAADMLAEDYLPENRFYTYHHFHDNCTTRVRDIIDTATDGALRSWAARNPGPSYRDYARRGFAEDTWMLLITDLLLGRDADARPNGWEVMFLPIYLRQAIESELGVEPVLVYGRKGRPLSDDPGIGGRDLYVILGLGLALLILVARTLDRFQRVALITTATLLFLVSLPMWFLALVSSLDALRYNEALLVFWPTDLAILWLRTERRERYAQIRIVGMLALSVLLALGVLVQPLHLLMLVALGPMAALAVPHGVLAALRDRLFGPPKTQPTPKPRTRSRAKSKRKGRPKRKR